MSGLNITPEKLVKPSQAQVNPRGGILIVSSVLILVIDGFLGC
jgi:hypothetical protein